MAVAPERSTGEERLVMVPDGTVTVAGDPADLGRLVALLAPVDPDFAIVTP